MKFDIKGITADIKAQIEYSKNNIDAAETGVITQINDDVVTIHGLKNCLINELVQFADRSYGIAMSLNSNSVLVVALGSTSNLKENEIVKRTFEVVSVPVGDGLLGRVISPLGEAIDGAGAIISHQKYPIERPAKSIMKRKSVSIPLQTGIKALDSLIPIGLGQRELIIGDRQTGKTSIALSTIINQKDKGIICIYVSIGKKKSNTVEVVKTLQENNAMANTIVVSAPASAPAALQYIAPFAACSMGEFFMEQGKNVLIIYDDLTQHAMAYRSISLLLKRPPGREAYPGDVFYLHSRLLERSASLSDKIGGGTLTALPIIETQAGNISAYIPTNVISITDGQIFLETDLFNEGILPAINPGISVSRVGGTAQFNVIKKLSGSLKLLYSQYMELESFSQFGSDLDEHTLKRLEQGKRIVEVFKQPENSPVSAGCQAVLFFALVNGFLDKVPMTEISLYEKQLCNYMHTHKEDVMNKVESNASLDDIKAELNEIATNFTENFTSKNILGE